MYLGRMTFVFCITTVLLFTRTEAASNNKKAETRSDCDHILPLMMMLGDAPTVHLPSIWLLGMLSVGALVLFGGGDFFWDRRTREEGEEEGEASQESNKEDAFTLSDNY